MHLVVAVLLVVHSLGIMLAPLTQFPLQVRYTSIFELDLKHS